MSVTLEYRLDILSQRSRIYVCSLCNCSYYNCENELSQVRKFCI